MAASLANLRRPAYVSAPRRSRAQLRVVAFRDTHRAKQLVDTAKEFALAWANGHTEGPTKPVMAALGQICAQDIRVRASHPQAGCLTLQGLDGIRAKLSRHQETSAGGSTPENTKAEVVVAAANDNTDAAFCLVRVPGIESRPEAFMLLKMDLMVDDGARSVIGVEERGQLFNATHTDAGKSTNQVATPFPKELVKPWGKENQASEKETRQDADMVQRVEGVLTAWSSARSSGTDVQKMMDQAALTQDFKLIDGYGSLPEAIIQEWEQLSSQLGSAGSLECPPPMSYYLPKKPKGTSVAEQSQAEVKDELEQSKKTYNVKCTLLDNAVCLDDAAAFSHWKAIQTNQITGETQEVDGVEVDILDPKTGGLRAVYLFRDSKKVRGQQEQENRTPVRKI